MSELLRSITVYLAFVAAATPLAVGQEPAAKDPVAEAGAVEEVGPPTFYLKDEKGNLVPVPGISYERFRELLAIEKRTGTPLPPTFTLEKLTLTGSVSGQRAELLVEVVVQPRGAGWVNVPLELTGCFLRGKIEHADTVRLTHRYDAKFGHSLWVQFPDKQPCTIKMPFTCKVQTTGGQSQLRLALPPSSESNFSALVDGAIVSPILASGEGLVKSQVDGGNTRVEVAGISGEAVLQWRQKTAPGVMALPAELEATTDISISVESDTQVSAVAVLHMRRPGKESSPFFVRLPRGFELSNRGGRGYSLSIASSEELEAAKIARDAESKEMFVRVDVDPPTEALDVEITANRKADASSQGIFRLQVSGFELMQATQQRGTVTLSIPSGWSLNSQTDLTTTRIDALPVTNPMVSPPAARFRFSRQPFSLAIDAAPQPARIFVEPEYQVRVDARELRMMARLKYLVRGPMPEKLEFQLGDWILDAAEPSEWLRMDSTAEGKPATIFVQGLARSEFEITLNLHQNLPAESTRVSWQLIHPLASQVQPALLTVTSADNIALNPLDDELVALVPEFRTATNSNVGKRPAANTLTYREVTQGDDVPQFISELAVRRRRVTATLQSKAQVTGNNIQFDQLMDLDVAYEPLTTLLVEAPESQKVENLQVFLGPQSLEVERADETASIDVTNAKWRVTLPQATIGPLNLLFRYSIPCVGNDLHFVPLGPSAIGGVVVVKETLNIQSDDGSQIRMDDSAQRGGAIVKPGERSIDLAWNGRAKEVDFHRSQRPATREAFQLGRLWQQVWLDPSARRDRLVLQVKGEAEQLSFILPDHVEPGDIVALSNGKAVVDKQLSGNRLTLHFTRPNPASQVIEVACLLPATALHRFPSSIVVQPLRLDCDTSPSQTFLQIITPVSEQVLLVSSDFSPQLAWRKSGWWWQRAGSLNTAELEAWSGGTMAEGRPLVTTDALYMTLGRSDEIRLVVCSRGFLWLAITGGVLVIGWMSLVLARGKNVWLGAGLCCFVALALLFAPELLFAVGQYGIVGLLLLVAVARSMQFDTSVDATRTLSIHRSKQVDFSSIRRNPTNPGKPTSAVRTPAEVR